MGEDSGGRKSGGGGLDPGADPRIVSMETALKPLNADGVLWSSRGGFLVCACVAVGAHIHGLL